MLRPTGVWLHARVLWELVRYDLRFACRGLRGVCVRESHDASSPAQGSVEVESAVCEALASLAPFYWKPLRCLQRSIVTARLMRRYGVPAAVVIGYRAAPFFSHAWVEIAGRVVNDSPSYKRRLLVLQRI